MLAGVTAPRQCAPFLPRVMPTLLAILHQPQLPQASDAQAAQEPGMARGGSFNKSRQESFPKGSAAPSLLTRQQSGGVLSAAAPLATRGGEGAPQVLPRPAAALGTWGAWGCSLRHTGLLPGCMGLQPPVPRVCNLGAWGCSPRHTL